MHRRHVLVAVGGKNLLYCLPLTIAGQRIRAFALQGRVPQIVLGTNPKTMPSPTRRSPTDVIVNFVLAKAGLKPSVAKKAKLTYPRG